jgi:glutamate--cysteine ligase
MPCPVPGDDAIPLARYGDSNVGTMKTAYRRGLGFRYGRAMQTIAGVHFNFSPGYEFWRQLQDEAGSDLAPRAFQSAAYFALVRNFRRYAWLILYLFGASPAVCKTFLAGRQHALEELDDDSWYLPYATSLRMSNLGYTSAAQSSLNISLNSIDEYVAGLTRAIRTPYPEYEKIGVEVDGQWRQLSANILQIANEFYSVVRPKRVAHSGEPPTTALRERGVEYVEIRALDIGPQDPVGVNQRQIRFLECFLMFCAVAGDDIISAQEQVAIDTNQALVAARGREPGLLLQRGGRSLALTDWALEICTALEPIAAALDDAHEGDHYRAAVALYRESVNDPEQTPSALLLADMRSSGMSHAAYGRDLAQRHKAYYQALPKPVAEREEMLTATASVSLAQQATVEASDRMGFAEYLQAYFERH